MISNTKMFFMIHSVFQVTLSSACLTINEPSWDAVLLMRSDSSPNSPTGLIYRFSCSVVLLRDFNCKDVNSSWIFNDSEQLHQLSDAFLSSLSSMFWFYGTLPVRSVFPLMKLLNSTDSRRTVREQLVNMADVQQLKRRFPQEEVETKNRARRENTGWCSCWSVSAGSWLLTC